MSFNRTSANFLLEIAKSKFSEEATGVSKANDRYLLATDLYIKARSYALINKTLFWISMLMAVVVIAWPALSILASDFERPYEFLKSAVVQTSVTAFAVLSYAIYSHYKKRQVMAENLMRVLIFDEGDDAVAVKEILAEMQKMDTGFSFKQVGSFKAET